MDKLKLKQSLRSAVLLNTEQAAKLRRMARDRDELLDVMQYLVEYLPGDEAERARDTVARIKSRIQEQG